MPETMKSRIPIEKSEGVAARRLETTASESTELREYVVRLRETRAECDRRAAEELARLRALQDRD